MRRDTLAYLYLLSKVFGGDDGTLRMIYRMAYNLELVGNFKLETYAVRL